MNKPPDYKHLRVIGCLSFPFQKLNDKFAEKAKRCVLIGYPRGQKGYKLYDLDTHKVVYSRDVRFIENVYPFKLKSAVLPTDIQPHQDIMLVNPALDQSSPVNCSFSNPPHHNNTPISPPNLNIFLFTFH